MTTTIKKQVWCLNCDKIATDFCCTSHDLSTDYYGTTRITATEKQVVAPSPRPWIAYTQNGACYISPDLGRFCVASLESDNAEIDGAEIVKCVNAYPRLVEAFRDEIEAIRTWQSARGIAADVRDGMQISLSKMQSLLTELEQDEVTK